MRGRALAASATSRLASARSTRSRHSPSSDSCIHSGTVRMVSATPIDASPPGENAQSSAARTLSILAAVDRQPFVGWPRLGLGLGLFKKIQIASGMALRHRVEFAALTSFSSE